MGLCAYVDPYQRGTRDTAATTFQCLHVITVNYTRVGLTYLLTGSRGSRGCLIRFINYFYGLDVAFCF